MNIPLFLVGPIILLLDGKAYQEINSPWPKIYYRQLSIVLEIAMLTFREVFYYCCEVIRWEYDQEGTMCFHCMCLHAHVHGDSG